MKIAAKYDYWLIILLGCVFYIPMLGGVHLFDWDEVNFAECAREMIAKNDYLRVHINFQPFWEKPPLFIWCQAACMQVFGVNDFAARLPNALVGIATLFVVYRIGYRMLNRHFAWCWVLCFFGAILPHLYSKSGIIDPLFNLLIFSSIDQFVQFYHSQKVDKSLQNIGFLYKSGILAGLAILTKGPVALLVIGLVMGVYWLMQACRWYVPFRYFLLFLMITFATTATWFGLDIIRNGWWFTTTFITYQIRLFSTEDAGHGGFVGYHFVVLLLGCFPASILALRQLIPSKRAPSPNHALDNYGLWMKILFWVVLILFSLVQSKIVHYSSLCYLPLTFLAARTCYELISDEHSWTKGLNFGFWTIGSIIALATIALPFLGQNIHILEPLMSKDPFAKASLAANANWTGWEILPGIFMFLLLIMIQNGKRFWANWSMKHSIIALFVGVAIFVQMVLIFDINNIEMYSQRAAIDFYKSKQNENCYVTTYNFKSFAHLYYTRKPANGNPSSADNQWLFHNNVDKPVYIVCKIQHLSELQAECAVQELYRKNGFVFLKRV